MNNGTPAAPANEAINTADLFFNPSTTGADGHFRAALIDASWAYRELPHHGWVRRGYGRDGDGGHQRAVRRGHGQCLARHRHRHPHFQRRQLRLHRHPRRRHLDRRGGTLNLAATGQFKYTRPSTGLHLRNTRKKRWMPGDGADSTRSVVWAPGEAGTSSNRISQPMAGSMVDSMR